MSYKKSLFIFKSILFSAVIASVPALSAVKEDSPHIQLNIEKAEKATQEAAVKGGDYLPTKPQFSIKKVLERLQNYLNSVTSLHAFFVQEDPDGTKRSGEVYIQKPGKMRLEYKEPTPQFVISDGTWISYDDKELDQVSYVPFSSTPASLILQEKIEFHDLFIDKIEYSPEEDILLSVRDKKDPSLGTLTLIFKNSPLTLIGWQVVDQSTQTTVVTLSEVTSPAEIPIGAFEIADPTKSH